MATVGTRRKSCRTKRIRYTEDSDDILETSTPPRSQPQRQSRMARPVQSYREESDDSADSNFDGVSDDSAPSPTETQHMQQSSLTVRSKMWHPRKRKRPVTRSSKHKPTFELFKTRKPNTSSVQYEEAPFTVVVPLGYIPPWQTLPYQVLLNIMKFAAYPLYGKASRASPSISWLLETSLLCKAFHEACYAALLFSPPLYPSSRAHGLIQLLRKDPTKTSTNYRSLIKCLDIEVNNLLVKKSGINAEDLISHTPLLQRLRLYHNHDDLTTFVWAQPSAMKGRKWSYPSTMADTIDRYNIKLHSFEWNGRFASPLEALNTMKTAHSHQSFLDVRDITFLNMTYPDKCTEIDVQLFSSLLLAGLGNLHSLRSIAFHNCDMLTDAVMSRLPPNLTRLEIASCSAFTSDQLTSYLSTNGSSLMALRLIGNQTMSLGFIPHLRTFCPRLQNLYIDLTYVDPTSYRDREPLYDELLPNGQPTWPSTLVNIDLEYLRQFSAEDAEGFFTSLVDAAPQLPCLRRLSIKAIINASWRDRAQMRRKWIPRLIDVFLCTDEPRRLFLPVRKKKPEQRVMPRKEKDKAGRRSGRIKEIQERREEESEFSDAPSLESTVSDQGINERRQGTCTLVELTLSDQRPAQDQYNEGDFLDDEMSGDEDFRA